MGNCMGGGTPMDAESQARHNAIEKELKAQNKVVQKEIKILLLGAGDTGKSTLIKQIKMIHKTGFTNEEREIFREVIVINILMWMHTLIAAVNNLGIKWGDESNPARAESIFRQIEDRSLPTIQRFSILVKNRDVFIALWQDSAIQEAFKHAHEFQVGESAKYFFNNLARIATDDYLPTNEDILLARVQTTGVVETKFEANGQPFCVVDVGGQRSERRKWIHCFEEVTAIIFFVALNEYNRMLFEEANVNRMKESLKLFDDIVNCVWFRETPIVLFLNKSDLFRDQLPKYPLSEYFPQYTGGDDFAAACDFIEKKYLALNKVKQRPIYPHVTCCTDTGQVKKVLESVWDSIFRSRMTETFDL